MTTSLRARLAEVQHLQYIGGSFVASHGESTLPVLSARTGAEIGRVADGTPADVDDAVAAATAAQRPWAALTIADRAGFLTAIAAELRARTDDIVELIADDIGSVAGISRAMQVGAAAFAFEDAAARVADALAETYIGNSTIVQQPRGVVGAITPWNFPLYQAALKVGPALAVGCTVVLKPSEVAGLTAIVLADIADAVGLPAGVFNLVSGSGPTVGEALVTHPDIAAVSFTGSDRAGARVAELAGAAVKPVTLELGGKSAHLVLDDSDLDAAVAYSVSSAFGNNGQVCASLSRLVVPRALMARAEQIALEKSSVFVPGDPRDPETRLGPLISEPQRQRFAALLQTAVDEGAKVVTGGPGLPGTAVGEIAGGFFVRPTILSEVDPMSTIGQEEAFGPLLTIIPFDGADDEGIRIVNGTRYGLNAAVWAGDPDRAAQVALQLDASTVYLNAAPFNPSAPFGGTKGSGFGRERGDFGLREFLQPKAIQK